MPGYQVIQQPGDLLCGDSNGTAVRLAGNLTTTRKLLRQTGNGSTPAAPVWDTLLNADVPALNGVTAGAVAAGKAVIADANKDVAGFRNITLGGVLTGDSATFSNDVTVTGNKKVALRDCFLQSQFTGQIVVGFPSTSTVFEFRPNYITHVIENDYGAYRESCYSNMAAHYSGIIINRAGGTQSSPVGSPGFANIGQLVFRSHNGSAFTGDVARISAASTESVTHSASQLGTKLSLFSTASGSTTLTESLILLGSRIGVNLAGAAPTAALDVGGDTLRLRTSRTPASASATGAAGEICWDASYLYLCVSSNTWRRIAHGTW